MGLLYASIQYHKYNTLVKFGTLFEIKLYTNYNNIQKESYLQKKQSNIQAQKTIFPIMSPPRGYFYDTIQSMFGLFDKGFKSMCAPSDQISDK